MPKPGDALRDDIARLLRMKFQDVTVEKRLETTTADVFFTDDTNPIFPRRIAIEAKDWKGRLSSNDIATIHNLYHPSLTNRTVDYVWIIGRQALSGSPRDSLSKLNNLRYSTYDEFRASLMNFSGLLNNNTLIFENGDVSNFFIHTRARDTGRPLFEHVMEWMTSDNNGLIVYGGYGLGKTTFSYYLASELSKRYHAGTFGRIPIRIALGGMYSKQDLIALICSALSGGEGGVSVKDFSYGLFLEMSKQGQYLLILDGFDEMRHAMDIDDFIFTFEQMKPLFAGEAKVVILGRPDSFLSTEEEEQVLSSLFDSGLEQNKRLSKIEVSFFKKDEVAKYLEKFLAVRKEKLSPQQQKNLSDLMERLPDSEDNILSRPVQLKMFTKIIDECLSKKMVLSRYELYRRFIYNFIARESQKAARQPKDGLGNSKDLRDDRAKFMQAVAWWVLNGKKENRFLPEEIPTDIIPVSLRTGRQGPTAVREAIVGSVIEPISREGVLGNKARKYYFFPHKSYLEFLIANYFDTNQFTLDGYREFMANVNNEILTFLEEGPPTGVDNLRQGLMHNVGIIDPRIVEVCATDHRVAKEISNDKKGNRHPSHIYTHYFYLRKRSISAESYLLARLADSAALNSLIATINCTAAELSNTPDSNLARGIILNCLTSISSHGLKAASEKGEFIKVFRLDAEGFRTAVAARCILASKTEFLLDIPELLHLTQISARGTLFVPIPTATNSAKSVSVKVDNVLAQTTKSIAALIQKLIGSQQKPQKWLPVELMGDAQSRFT